MMTASKNISSTDTLTAAMNPVRILMAAGGTGGHVYPAIAIADAIKKRSPQGEILFVGTRDRMEWDEVPKSGYKIVSVWISGFHRRFTLQNLLFPFKLITSIVQSLMIILSFKPDLVVSCGGFAAGPIGWVASMMGIPIVIQEQNSFPGVTNRLLAKHAETIFTAFEDAENYFPKEKISLAGNPVRQQIEIKDKIAALAAFGFRPGLSTLLLLGGSGGSLALNKAMQKKLHHLHQETGLQIIWQCGERYYDKLKKEIDTGRYPNLRLVKFIDDMPAAYSAADLVVTRSGASTCSELMMVGQPAILVPSPNVAGDHQAKNAQSMAAENAAVLLPEKKLDTAFAETIEKLIFDRKELERMSMAIKEMARPHAADTIARKIFDLAKRSENE